jgi:hypothetical protein
VRPFLRSGWIVAFALVASAGAATTARADSRTAAEALFQAGRAAARSGDAAGACTRFRESHRLDPALGTRLNLALCEEELGRTATAWGLFLSLVQTLPEHDERSRLAREHLDVLDRLVPRVTLVVSGPTPSGFKVILADASITEMGLGVAIPVDPGSHQLEVVTPGGPTRRQEFAVAAGESRIVHIEGGPGPAPVSAGDASASKSAPGSPLRVAGVVAFGAAGASLAASLTLGFLAMRRKGVMDEHCGPDGACSRAGLEAAREGQTFVDASTATFVGACALAAVGTTLFIWQGRSRRSGSATPLTLLLSPGGIGLRGAL